jgi:hypothetical protein
MNGIVLVIILLLIGTPLGSAFNIQPLSGYNHLSRGDTLYVGGAGPANYTRIQDAIDNATDGDTIIVYPGTYHENQLLITKALTIQGAGFATTIIDGNDAILSTEGLVRITANGDITFHGFTVQHAGGPAGYGGGDNKLNMGIAVLASSPDVTYTISSNKIIGTGDPDDDYDWGFYAISGGQENIIFTQNIVTQTGCNNIVIENTTGSTNLSFNTLDAGCWGIDSIYYMTYDGVNITTPQVVRNNTIDVGTGINPGGSSSNKVTGIGFSSAYLGCTGVPDSGTYTQIIISGNIINNVQAWRRGIAIDNFAWDDGTPGVITNTQITNNIINGNATTPTSFGIRLSGLVTNTSIIGNQINQCDMSFWGRTGYYGGSTAYPTGTIIHNNSFTNSGEGLIWEGASLLNAEYNYWGDPSGPTHPGNPGGKGDNVTGNVDYTPWLLYFGQDNTEPYVKLTQPVKGYLYVNIRKMQMKIPFIITIVIGSINVTVNAQDNQSGIQKVEFYLDSDLQSTDTSAPYVWNWNEHGFFPYTVKVIVYDNCGNHHSDELKLWKIF